MPVQNLLEPFTRPAAPRLPAVHVGFAGRVCAALAEQRAICHDPMPAAERVFADILRESGDTEFGRAHGLASVRTPADWRKAIPIQQYEDVVPYIERIKSGHRNVLTVSQPYAFLKTSGSSGVPKHVPTTRHWRDAYRGPALYAQWGLYFEQVPSAGDRVAEVLDLSWDRSRVAGFGAAVTPVYSIAARPAAVSGSDWLPPWYDEAWFVSEPGEAWDAALYRKLRLRAGHEVRVLVSLNPSKIISLAQVLDEHAADLVADLHDGTLAGARRPGVAADRETADRLAAVLAARGRLTLSDVWPGLELAVCWNSGSAALYRGWLDRVIPGVRRLPFSTTGTEGIVTIPVDGHPSAGPLAVNQGLYEFVVADDRDGVAPDAEVLGFEELEEGREYRLILSQANGLLRYDVGDVYRVVGRYGATPRLEFTGRAGFRSSFTGEKLTELQVHQAVTESFPRRLGSLPLFTCVPRWGTPPDYLVVIEQPDGLTPADLAAFGRSVDTALQRINPEYGEKRRSRRLGPLTVECTVPDGFARLEDALRARGTSAVQIKHHWLQRDERLLGTLRDLGLLAGTAAEAGGASPGGRT